ncbi:MAG TPA: cell envelope integrity protein TolA [Lysobacter sp.]|nr:cell envelope integrity protein TolA [Lysobacter sp.]
MRETRADTARAFVLAVALHALLFALMFFGLWWTRQSSPQPSWGVPVQAEVVDANALSPSLRRALKQEAVKPPPPPPAPKEEPRPEPLPEEIPPPPQPLAQEKLPEPEPVDQEEVRADAVSPETRPREQEAKQRQAQVDLDEQKRQEQEQQKQRELQAQLEKIQAERAKAKRDADRAAQKLQQIADWKAQQASESAASASPPPGDPDANDALRSRYAAALAQAIRSNWTRPDNVPLTVTCVINITQLPGGKVIDVQVSPSCPYDTLGKRSVEAAVLKAQPLPYAGFESVFSRALKLNFQAEDN